MDVSFTALLAVLAPLAAALGTGAEALLLDLVRLGHLGAVAVGLGVVVATDLTLLRLIGLPLGPRQGRVIEAAHGLLVPALAAAWATGLGLAALRTGLDPVTVTPKLLAKLAVVSLLTANAALIQTAVRPILADHRGRRIQALPLGHKLVLAIAGGLSVAGWGSALLLGASAVMRDAGWDVLVPLIGGLHALALTLTLGAAILSHRRPGALPHRRPHRRPQRRPRPGPGPQASHGTPVSALRIPAE
ncbi:MAG: hypothetical protein AAFV86_07460 [Pseudomonadota bacterium]